MTTLRAPTPRAPTPRPPTQAGPLQRREARLAFCMLVPTFLIVLAIVLFPLLANFWISLKPVQLADLRGASALANERMKVQPKAAGDRFQLDYRLRNSSQKDEVADVGLSDVLPAGLHLDPAAIDRRCRIDGRQLTCLLGDYPPKFRETLSLSGTAAADYIADPVNPRDSRPLLTGTSESVLTNFELTLENFRRVIGGPEFWPVLRVSLVYTIFGTLGALVLGLFAAQLMNTVFPFRGVLRGLFLFPYVAPVIAVAFTWVLLLDAGPGGALNAIMLQLGVVDGPVNFLGARSVPVSLFGLTFDFPLALTTVIAFEAWRYFPLSFLFILARMQSVSAEMYEAAEMDGATPLQQFRYLSLPHLMGILAVLFLLRFIWTFNKFDDIFLLTGGGAGTRTLTVDVYEQAFALSNLGSGAAVAVIVFIVLLAFSLVFFRFSPKDE